MPGEIFRTKLRSPGMQQMLTKIWHDRMQQANAGPCHLQSLLHAAASPGWDAMPFRQREPMRAYQRDPTWSIWSLAFLTSTWKASCRPAWWATRKETAYSVQGADQSKPASPRLQFCNSSDPSMEHDLHTGVLRNMICLRFCSTLRLSVQHAMCAGVLRAVTCPDFCSTLCASVKHTSIPFGGVVGSCVPLRPFLSDRSVISDRLGGPVKESNAKSSQDI